MILETIIGNLRNAYKHLVPGTMLHATELMNERIINEELRDQWFYTADGAVYFLNDGVPTLAMTREAQNPVLNNIDVAFKQLTQHDNYRVLSADLELARQSPDTLTIPLSRLRLSGNNVDWGYLAIGTTPSKYRKLNGEERKLAERIYGQEDDFTKNMKMLKDARINEMKVYVLNPDYVRKHASEGAIARASWLNDFDGDSNFDAVVRLVGSRGALRGVRKKSSNDLISAQECDNSSHSLRRESFAEGDAKNLGPYRTLVQNEFKAHYDALLADPESAVKAMDDKTAAGLAGIIQAYLAIRG